MLGPDTTQLLSVWLIFILNYTARRIDGAENGSGTGTEDALSESSLLTAELRSPPDKLSVFAKQTTKVDFVTDKLDQPSSRILNHVSTDGHHKHGGPKPSCAKELDYCLFNEDYPEDAVHEILNNYHDDMHHIYNGMNHYPSDEYLAHENYTLGYRHKGNFVCESEVAYIRPGWAKNWMNEWVAVVNTEKYPQSIRIETCKFGGKKCEYLPPCYRSFCVQRFAYVKLLCVDPYNPHHRPVVDVFEVPTACSCFVENFVYY